MLLIRQTLSDCQACTAQACEWTDGPLKMLIVAGAVRFESTKSTGMFKFEQKTSK